ncbi:MAG: chemotaxis response regulator protein-glutamate methylesterase [Gammaproteobacteria bacterium]|nr:MAG: chemotaxis response regulator protein-glutamate methylesterase [Gammaproteobacteria bacterium]
MVGQLPIRVLVVDDSALVRSLLSKMLNAADDIEVVGVASDPYIARDKIKALNPDVLTLDVEMPKMDGVTFLRNLMRLRPMPVVMVSSLTEKSADVTLQALEIGAVDFVTKPKIDLSHSLESYSDELLAKVRYAARANVRQYTAMREPAPKYSTDQVLPRTVASTFRTTDRIIAIGASTGGTEAIKSVLVDMPSDAPGIVIAQHIPPGFSAAFADRLNRQTPLVVKEAEDGDQVIPGHAFVAPGNRHLLLVRDGARYVCRLSDAEPVNRHKPSVDVLFRSVLQSAGKNATACILTGMGADGAQGLLELKEAGIHTIAQDEKTSVVWGMPGEAVKRGGATEVLPLQAISDGLIRASTDATSTIAQ